MINTWIFQSNPKDFDIEDFFKQKPTECKWLVTRFDEKMRIGDIVFIWRAIGREPRELAGVVARAQLVDDVKTQEDDSCSRDFWIDASKASEQVNRVTIRFLKIAPLGNPIQYDTVKNDPALRAAQIFRQPNATNFLLSESEALRFEELWQCVTPR